MPRAHSRSPRWSAFGRHPEIGAAVQTRLREAGLAATTIMVLADGEAGDAQLAKHLNDGVVIGSFINGQDPQLPPTEQTTLWFNRVLNTIHAHAPSAPIILVRSLDDAPRHHPRARPGPRHQESADPSPMLSGMCRLVPVADRPRCHLERTHHDEGRNALTTGMDLPGKIVIVTGASFGTGAAAARRRACQQRWHQPARAAFHPW